MKSALNGGLNLSIRDGWWDEWYDGENGWEIPTADGLVDEARRDDLEAAALYELLDDSVAPKFYDRDERRCADPLGRDGAPHPAGARAQGAGLAHGAGLHRALLRARGAVVAPDRRHRRSRPARELAAYRLRVQQAWPNVEITDVDSTGLPDTPLLGSELTLTATVQLAGLRPDEVVVEAVLGRVDASDSLLDPQTVAMTHTGTGEGGVEVFSTTCAAARRGFGGLHRAATAA